MKGAAMSKPWLFICYPNCSTCKRAQAFLDTVGEPYTVRDIKIQNPDVQELKTWYQRSGLPLKRFFNTSGLRYKELGLKEKLPGMTEEQQLQLLATDGMLVKRPLLVGQNFVLVGFRQEQWEKAFKKEME